MHVYTPRGRFATPQGPLRPVDGIQPGVPCKSRCDPTAPRALKRGVWARRALWVHIPWVPTLSRWGRRPTRISAALRGASWQSYRVRTRYKAKGVRRTNTPQARPRKVLWSVRPRAERFSNHNSPRCAAAIHGRSACGRNAVRASRCWISREGPGACVESRHDVCSTPSPTPSPSPSERQQPHPDISPTWHKVPNTLHAPGVSWSRERGEALWEPYPYARVGVAIPPTTLAVVRCQSA